MSPHRKHWLQSELHDKPVWVQNLDRYVAGAIFVSCVLVIAFGLERFDFDVIASNFGYMMIGLGETWKLGASSYSLGLLVGVLLAVARETRLAPLRGAAIAYIELFRNVPQLMVIFWAYFLAPTLTGYSINAKLAALAALTACISAYLSDVVRAGLNSVSEGQMEAASATGLTYWQQMRWVILPQALRNMIPSLVNQFVSAFKTTSLVYIIGVIEFFRAAMIVNEREFQSLEIFTFVGVVYFVNCFSMSTMARWFERRLQRLRPT